MRETNPVGIFAALAAVAMTIALCASVARDAGEEEAGPPRDESEAEAEPQSPREIILLIDNSPTMASYVAELQKEVASLRVARQDIRYRLMIFPGKDDLYETMFDGTDFDGFKKAVSKLAPGYAGGEEYAYDVFHEAGNRTFQAAWPPTRRTFILVTDELPETRGSLGRTRICTDLHWYDDSLIVFTHSAFFESWPCAAIERLGYGSISRALTRLW